MPRVQQGKERRGGYAVVWRPGWKKVLTQIKVTTWRRLRARAYIEGRVECGCVEEALCEWLSAREKAEEGLAERGGSWMVRKGGGELF